MYISILYKCIGVIPNFKKKEITKKTRKKKKTIFEKKLKYDIFILKKKFKIIHSVVPKFNIKNKKKKNKITVLKNEDQNWKNNKFKYFLNELTFLKSKLFKLLFFHIFEDMKLKKIVRDIISKKNKKEK